MRDVIVTWLQNDYGQFDRVAESLAHALVESGLARRVVYLEPPVAASHAPRIDRSVDEGLSVYRVEGQGVDGPSLADAVMLDANLEDPVLINVGTSASNWWYHHAFAPHASARVLIAMEPQHLWPGLPARTVRFLAGVRSALVRASDHVWGTARGAIADLSAARYLGAACDRGLETAVLDDLAEPEDLARLPHPRALYSGSLSARVDVQALAALAESGVQVVVIGHSAPQETLSVLASQRRLTYLGPRRAADMPAYYRHCDVGLVAHTDEPLTWTMEPRKLYNYAATGLPSVVLNCMVPEALAPFVTEAETTREFIERCLKLGEGGRLSSAEVETARSITWRSLAGRLLGEVTTP